MNISVIGSCLPKEILKEKITKNQLKGVDASSCFTLTSMLSIMSKPVLYNYRRLLMSGMDDSQMNRWFYEFEKSALKVLESEQPDVLVLDFYADARYGARAHIGEYITNRIEELVGTSIIRGKNLGIRYTYETNTDDFIMVWKNFFDRFMALMNEKMPDTQIIVNTIKGSNVIVDESKTPRILPGLEEIDVERMNEVWRIMDEYAIKKYKLKAITYEKKYALSLNCRSRNQVELVDFCARYYEDCFERLLEIIEKPSEDVSRESDVNLVVDSAYKQDLYCWTNMAGQFELVDYLDYRAIRVVDCRDELGKYAPQIWSRPIEIEGSGETSYTLSFYIKIPDMRDVNEETILFRIRTFDTIKGIKADESIDWYRLTAEGHAIEDDKEYRYVYTFKPKGRFLKLAPFMTGYIPGVEYSRIKLERSSSVSDYTK